MKKIKKLFLGLLVIGLLFSGLLTVHADTTGSITVNGTTKDKTYEIYKIFNLTYQGTKVAYTIDEDFKAFFEGDGSEYIIDNNPGNLNAITIGSEMKYINITSENIEGFTSDVLVYAAKLEGNDGSKTASGNSLTFNNLALGYYLVYPQGATDIKEEYASICSITSTVPNGEVNIKADYPTIEKTVDDANAFVGQFVTFTIKGKVPDTTGFDTYTYQISDTMTSGLKLDATTSEFTVKFGDTVIEATPTYQENGFTLTFDMNNYQEYVKEEIVITYKVLVTEEAVNSDTTKNSATLTYSRDPKTSETNTTPKEEVFVYSSEVNVLKVDANDESVMLSGASFVLQNSSGLYYQAVDANDLVITNTTKTETLVKVNWVESLDNATLLVTDDMGKVTFEGIENGTYYLVETIAPNGYNKLADPVTVKVGYTDESGTNLGSGAVSHVETVENNSGTTLPETGGMGTTLFIVIGSLFMIIPVMIFVVNRRMNKEY